MNRNFSRRLTGASPRVRTVRTVQSTFFRPYFSGATPTDQPIPRLRLISTNSPVVLSNHITTWFLEFATDGITGGEAFAHLKLEGHVTEPVPFPF
jgi:hypothetical protein